MSHPNRYEIEIRGRATRRALHPVIDDFRIVPTERGTTRLVGEVRDPSHLHGILAHLTSFNVDLVAMRRLDEAEAGSGASDRHDPPQPSPVHRPRPTPNHDNRPQKGIAP